MDHETHSEPPSGREGPRRVDELTFADRYRALEVVKTARGIITYRGVDAVEGGSVVIKTTDLRQVPEGTELLLRHEAAVLRDIDSPHVAPLLHVGVERDVLFLVVPFVAGVTLEDRLRTGPLGVPDALALGLGLVDALAAVFDHGVLHRDVKPANVIVDDESPITRVTLIDFGFSRSDHLDRALRDVPLGTARYASPEQAGLVSRDVDERSDLYSLGVVLFEVLAGRPPFTGATVGDVLRQHLTAPVPSLRALGVAVPRALDELIGRLLSKDPKDRYQTATAVQADLAEIHDGIARGIDDPPVVIGTHDRRCCVLGEPSFVGRTNDLARLQTLFDSARAGSVALGAVEAESGGGKTRLLDEFARQAAEQGAWVARGQGVDQAAQRPFQALQGVADAVVAAASDDPAIAERLRTRMGIHRAAACAALPALTEILEPHDQVEPGPEAHGVGRSVAALAALLDALGSPDRPAVVTIDDYQWVDPLTARLLSSWRARPSSPSRGHVLVIVAYRRDDVSLGHPLQDVRGDSVIRLAPLGEVEVRQLVESMGGALGDEAVSTVVNLAEGSPFMASAVLHGLVESGALVCRHPGWDVDLDRLSDVQSSSRAATFLARRLQLLPSDALVLLSAGAVLGKEFDLELAAHLVGHDPAEAVRARDEARRRHLLWTVGSGARLAFVHDKVREALLARLRPDARRALHAAAAERIQAVDPTRTFELAYHFDAAGRPDLALAHALAAAEEARAQHALEIAEEQYRIAQRASSGGRATELAVATGLGDVTMLLGRYEEARAHYLSALELTDGALARSDLEARIGELAFKHGDLAASAAASERGLRLLGRRVQRRRMGFALAAVAEIVIQTLHTLFPRWWVARRKLDEAGPDLLAARHYSRLAHVYWFSRGAVPTLWGHLRELNIAERYPPTRELAQAYSEHGPAMSLVPWFARGVEYVDRSHRIRTELHDVWGQAQSLSFSAIVLFAAGRHDEVIERCREAIRLFERTGDRWELNIARLHLAFALYRQGRLPEALQVARRAYRDGIEIGDLQASGLGVEIWSKAAGGRVPANLVARELSRETPDVQLRVEIMQAEAVRLLREQEAARAAAILREAHALARGAELRNEYVAPTAAWLATALRSQLEALPPYAPDRARLRREVRRVVRRARRGARVYRNNRPHALREAGLVAALGGRPRRARRLLRRSIAVALEQGASAEHARSLAALGHLATVRGWPGADEMLLDATQQLEVMERGVAEVLGGHDDDDRSPAGAPPARAGVTLSLVDRFDTLLDQGRRLAAGLSRDAVFVAVERAAVRLLRAEHCTVLDVTEGPDGPSVSAGATGEPEPLATRSVSSSLLSRAIETGRPAVSDEAGGDPSDSLVLAGVRSALCAPILERGRVTAWFYATHRAIAGLFGDDEVRMAEFVATLAGAALENAHGFAEVEGLQRSLEHRVAERTQQLTTTLHELERVNEQLREANQAKSDFVSMVSHELRTPLTPIVGLSSTLLRRWESLDDAVRDECLTSIHRQGVRLARLVDDLLEMSRIEAGTVETLPRAVDVRALVDTTIAGLSEGMSDVEVDCPLDIVAMADPDRVQQILVNYLENARKYGHPPYRVRVRASGSWVEVAVCDEGPGVPEEFADRLFDKFTRAPGTSKDAAGTGLGLSIVRGLAEAQGGEAWYEPNRPGGARFCVRLPRSTVSLRLRTEQPTG